jgi:hypothetical protein
VTLGGALAVARWRVPERRLIRRYRRRCLAMLCQGGRRSGLDGRHMASSSVPPARSMLDKLRGWKERGRAAS